MIETTTSVDFVPEYLHSLFDISQSISHIDKQLIFWKSRSTCSIIWILVKFWYTISWLKVLEYMCHKLPRICSTCKHFPVLSSFTAYYLARNKISATCATSGGGTAHSSGAPEFTPRFSGICLIWSLFLIVMFWRSLFVFLSFFFLPLCCMSFFNMMILIAPLVSSSSS